MRPRVNTSLTLQGFGPEPEPEPAFYKGMEECIFYRQQRPLVLSYQSLPRQGIYTQIAIVAVKGGEGEELVVVEND